MCPRLRGQRCQLAGASGTEGWMFCPYISRVCKQWNRVCLKRIWSLGCIFTRRTREDKVVVVWPMQSRFAGRCFVFWVCVFLKSIIDSVYAVVQKCCCSWQPSCILLLRCAPIHVFYHFVVRTPDVSLDFDIFECRCHALWPEMGTTTGYHFGWNVFHHWPGFRRSFFLQSYQSAFAEDEAWASTADGHCSPRHGVFIFLWNLPYSLIWRRLGQLGWFNPLNLSINRFDCLLCLAHSCFPVIFYVHFFRLLRSWQLLWPFCRSHNCAWYTFLPFACFGILY